MNPTTENKLHFWLPFWGIVGINLLLKGIFITYNELSYDEPFSFFHAGLPPSDIIRELTSGNNPPLYELFMHYWMQLFGSSLFSVRFPSLLFASFVPAFWFAGVYTAWRKPVAYLLAILLTFNNQQLMFAHEMRGYAMAFFLAGAALFCFFRVRNLYVKILFTAAFLALSLYTHYLSVFLAGTVWLFILLFGGDKRCGLWQTSVLSFLFVLPLAWVFYARVSDPGNTLWGDAPKISHLWGNINIAFNYRFWPLLGVFLLSMADPKVRGRWKQVPYYSADIRQVGVLLAWFGFCYLLLFGLSFKWPVFMGRYLSFIFIGLFFCAAFIFTYFYDAYTKTRGWLILMVLIVISGFNWRQGNDYHPSQTAEQLRRFKQQYGERALVLVYPEWYRLTLGYYISDELRHSDVYSLRPRLLERGILPPLSPEEAENYIRQEAPPHILYIDAGEEFVFGNHAMYDMLKHAGYVESAAPLHTDKQVTLYTFRAALP